MALHLSHFLVVDPETVYLYTVLKHRLESLGTAPKHSEAPGEKLQVLLGHRGGKGWGPSFGSKLVEFKAFLNHPISLPGNVDFVFLAQTFWESEFIVTKTAASFSKMYCTCL